MDTTQYIKSKTSVLIYGFLLATTSIFSGYLVGIFNAYFCIFIKAAYQIYDVSLQKEIQGNLNFFFLLGGTIACLITGTLIDKLGRYRFLIILSTGEVTALLLLLIKNLYFLYACRLMLGFLACSATFICTLMIKEVVPERYSSSFNNSVYVFYTIGMLISNLLSKEWMGLYWRWILPLPLCTEFPKLLCFLFIYKIESPKTILSKNGHPDEELIENYKMIYDETGARQETKKQLKEFEMSRLTGKAPTFGDLFTRRYRIAFLIGLLLNFLNQATGVNFLQLYSSEIFTSMKMKNPQLLTSALGVLNFLGAIYVALFGKFHGKRALLIFGLTMQAFGHFIFLLGISLDNGYLVILGVFLYMVCFSVSLGGSLFPYLADTVPAIGISYTALSQWLLACFIGKFAMCIMDKFGAFNVFYFFMAVTFVGCITFTGYSINTDGKSESQVQGELEQKQFMI